MNKGRINLEAIAYPAKAHHCLFTLIFQNQFFHLISSMPTSDKRMEMPMTYTNA